MAPMPALDTTDAQTSPVSSERSSTDLEKAVEYRTLLKLAREFAAMKNRKDAEAVANAFGSLAFLLNRMEA